MTRACRIALALALAGLAAAGCDLVRQVRPERALVLSAGVALADLHARHQAAYRAAAATAREALPRDLVGAARTAAYAAALERPTRLFVLRSAAIVAVRDTLDALARRVDAGVLNERSFSAAERDLAVRALRILVAVAREQVPGMSPLPLEGPLLAAYNALARGAL